MDSIESAKRMLTDVFQRLHLKDKKFEASASETDINKFSENIKLLDSAACLDTRKIVPITGQAHSLYF